MVVDCKKKAEDRANGIFRYNIAQPPQAKKPKMDVVIKEYKVDYTATQLNDHANKTSDGCNMDDSSGSIDLLDDSFNHMDVDSPGSDFVDLGSVTAQTANQVHSQPHTLEDLARETREVKLALDKVIKDKYPNLFYPRTLSKNDWALDGYCGSNLSGDINVFNKSSLKPTRQYTFTFGQGSKLYNTHIGSVSLWFDYNNNGHKRFTFNDVCYVPGARSNILSEYILKGYGFNIIDSGCGNYKYVF